MTEQLTEKGYNNIISFDISKVCVDKMKERAIEKKLDSECGIIRDDL